MCDLTQGETAIKLQVGSEESCQTAEQFAAGLSSVELVAAVDQTVCWAAIVSFIQNSQQELSLTNDHLKNTVHYITTPIKNIPFYSRTW